jgi:diguanylate cyclase (GGDEF)-like protein
MISESSIARVDVAGLPQDRLDARVLAHALIEQSQVTPRPELLGRLAEQARAAGWGEVRVVLLHCQLIGRSLQGAERGAVRASSDAMLNAAQATADEILIALALASRALFVVDAEHPDGLGEDVGGLLAQAVAMLDDTMDSGAETLGLRAVEVPACYVECGQAFHRLGLWELEEEMYARATSALDLPLPPQASVVPGFTRRALVVNRLENALSLSCALLEIGQREPARRVAANSVRPGRAERDDLPPMWAVEVLALEHFLDAIAGGVRREVPSRLYGQLEASTWTGYRACLLLATAVGAHDLGDVATAAGLAEHALSLLDDHMPSITTLAMHLAAQGTQDEATWRYARHLAGLRWQTRLAVLDAFRSRLAAARVLRQGEQLNRKAYADALTGLANRHAEVRHLARLRRRGREERLLVILIDVDHFKAVNDTFGHGAGDEVLRVIGAILQAVVRPSDLAVRRGGDEFMLLIDLPPGIDVPIVADGVVRSIARHRWADVAPGLAVGVSAGEAMGAARDVDDLIHAADENVYRAKGGGRGRAVAAAGLS